PPPGRRRSHRREAHGDARGDRRGQGHCLFPQLHRRGVRLSMAISRRERTIMIATGAAAVLLLGDKYFLTPHLETRERVVMETSDCLGRLERANRMISKEMRSEEHTSELQSH